MRRCRRVGRLLLIPPYTDRWKPSCAPILLRICRVDRSVRRQWIAREEVNPQCLTCANGGRSWVTRPRLALLIMTTQCPQCHHAELTKHGRRYYPSKKGYHPMYKCRPCGMVFIDHAEFLPGPKENRGNYTPKECLRCGKLFNSHGISNRLCDSCRNCEDVKNDY